MQNILSGPLLSILDATLFMSNQILKRFIFDKNDFHQKFAKIEDFTVDYMSLVLRLRHLTLAICRKCKIKRSFLQGRPGGLLQCV